MNSNMLENVRNYVGTSYIGSRVLGFFTGAASEETPVVSNTVLSTGVIDLDTTYNTDAELETAKHNLRIKTGLNWLHRSELPERWLKSRGAVSTNAQLVCLYRRDPQIELMKTIYDSGVLFSPVTSYSGEFEYALFLHPLHIREMAKNKFEFQENTEEEIIQAKNNLCVKTGLNWMSYSELPEVHKTRANERGGIAPFKGIICFSDDLDEHQFARSIRERDVLFIPKTIKLGPVYAMFKDPLEISEMAIGNFKCIEISNLLPEGRLLK